METRANKSTPFRALFLPFSSLLLRVFFTRNVLRVTSETSISMMRKERYCTEKYPRRRDLLIWKRNEIDRALLLIEMRYKI